MRFFRLLPLSLSLLACVGLTALIPATAAADEEAPPARTEVKLRLPAPAAKGAPAAPQKDPIHTVMRWAMGEVGSGMAEAGAGMDEMLTKWFEGGDDVPMAGLRDAFKADGWTPEQLKTWMTGHVMRNAPRVMRGMRVMRDGGGGGHVTVLGPMGRSFTVGGAMPGHGGGDCPLCGDGKARRRGPWGNQGWGNRGRGPHMRGNGMRGRGMRGPGRGRWMRRGMQGPMRVDRRTMIFWNDGNGWQHRTMPGRAGHGTGGGMGTGHGMRHGTGAGMGTGRGMRQGTGAGRGMRRGGQPGHGGGPGGMHGGPMPPWMHHFLGAGPGGPPMRGGDAFRGFVIGPDGEPMRGARRDELPVRRKHGQRRGAAGAARSFDVKELTDLARRLEGLAESGGDLDIEALQDLLRRLQGAVTDKKQPRVRVRVHRPKADDAAEVEIEEEIVIEGGGGR